MSGGTKTNISKPFASLFALHASHPSAFGGHPLPQGEREERILVLSHHHHDRIFDQLLECAEQFGPERAIDRTVIAGQRDAHHLRHFDLAVPDGRALLAGADREDGGVRRGAHGGRRPASARAAPIVTWAGASALRP